MSTPQDIDRLQSQMKDTVKAHWKAFLIEGVVLVILGLLAASLSACATTPGQYYSDSDPELDQMIAQGNQNINANNQALLQQTQSYQNPTVSSYQKADGTWVYCRRATDMMVTCTQ